MTKDTRVEAVARAYRRNGFMNLSLESTFMGRRVEPGEHPAVPGDVNMDPMDPPETDLGTPSPHRYIPRPPHR